MLVLLDSITFRDGFMALHWLHLSDIHFHPKDAWRDGRARREFLTFLEGRLKQGKLPKPDFIFCTGDIAFGEFGKHPLAEQYAQAKAFFDDLLKICGCAKQRLFVVPGNHDVQRSAINEDAQAALVAMADDSRARIAQINARLETQPNPFKDAMKRLQAYADFIADYLPHQHDKEGRCIYTHTIELGGLKIGIAGLNSAWSCAGPEDDRHLWLGGEWQFNRASTHLHKTDLRIGLIHHPTDWLCEAERETAQHRIAADFDFWLFGHMHNTWVEPLPSHVRIGAGALGAGTPDEFGFNVVSLNEQGRGQAHLFQFRQGWTIHPIAGQADEGVWEFALPERMQARIPDKAGIQGEAAPQAPAVLEAPSSPSPSPVNAAGIAAPAPYNVAIAAPTPTGVVLTNSPVRLFGRDKLLADCANKLRQRPILLLYGMRGNGKSMLLDSLAQQPPLAGKECLRLVLHADSSPHDIFRALAWSLGEQGEHPQAPSGDAQSIAATLRKKYPVLQHALWLHLDRAHLLLKADGLGFKDVAMRQFLLGLHQAYGAQLPMVLELRERPGSGLLGSAAHEVEVPGLDRQAMGEMLAASSPEGSDWHYSGDKLKRIYGWIGAGGGKTAHPLTLSLLIQVARGSGLSPEQVLDRHSVDLKLALEERLLNDLYQHVLNENEQVLLATLALYRGAIPHDHADWLERKLDLEGGWDGLHRRCLLASDAKGQEFFLHGFIAEWLRKLQGYTQSGNEEAVWNGDEPQLQALVRRRQMAIGECWLQQLGGGKRRTQLNIGRALEAFYHLLEANEGGQIHGIAVELLSGKLDWALQKIKKLYEYLFQSKAPRSEQMKALEYWLHLDPQEPRAWRFLGECYAKEEGWKSEAALRCFNRCCELLPGYPQYWANLGSALREHGAAGAQEFLQRLEVVERDYPQAVNDYVRAIQADCLAACGQSGQARRLRQQAIQAGSAHAAFYNDEARALDAEGQAEQALELLQLARKRGFHDDVTQAIESKILQDMGRGEEARAQRLALIAEGSKHPTYYNDEASACLQEGRPGAALAVLEQAQGLGITNDYLEAVHANALEAAGESKAALALREAKINANSRNPAFYNDQAKTLAKLQRLDEALAVLDLAERRGIANEYTRQIYARLRRP